MISRTVHGTYAPKLTESQVLDVVNLWNQNLGNARISMLTGIEFETIRNITRGKAWRSITGGRLSNGRREAAKWKHSSKTFWEVDDE